MGRWNNHHSGMTMGFAGLCMYIGDAMYMICGYLDPLPKPEPGAIYELRSLLCAKLAQTWRLNCSPPVLPNFNRFWSCFVLLPVFLAGIVSAASVVGGLYVKDKPPGVVVDICPG